MSRYKAYPEYKDSGVEWLGSVPQHWNARQLKFICTCNDEVLGESIHPEYEIEYIDIGSVSASEGISKTETMMFSGAPSRARRIVRDGDVIVSTVRTYLEAIASIDNPPPNLIVSTGFAVIRPNQYLHKKFAAYCLRTSGFIKEVIARSVGVSYPAINASDLINIKAPLPQFSEQRKIANFLDHETAKIDTLIAKQQELIKLLKEKRQAVISHAVTKGLNPNAPMRDSGVEWLGEVPAHWDTKKLKYLCDLQTGDKNTEDAIDEGIYPFFVRSQTVERLNTFTADCEAVLTAGDGAGVGKVFHYFVGKFDFHQRVYMMNKFRFVTGKFFFHYLENMFHKVALDGGAKSTVDSLRMPLFLNFQFTVPPRSEQLEIIKFIEKNNDLFNRLTMEASKAISLMQERRTALISAAVTGKIDVRDWQPPSESAIAA